MRQVRRLVQVAAFFFFLYLFVFTTYLEPQPEISNLFYRLDPLVAIVAMAASRVFIAGMALAGLTILVTVLFGRVWCGWICPFGSILDVFKPSQKRRRKAPPDQWRVIKYIVLLVVLFVALFGSQFLIFLDPLTILTRTLTVSVWPSLGYSVAQVESVLYQFDVLWPVLDNLHQGLVIPLFQETRPLFHMAFPFAGIFVLIVGLNWLAERFWCRYLCPLGGLLGLVSRFALFRRVVSKECVGCAACSRHCPTGTIRVDQGFTSDPAECIVCYECIDACSKQGDQFRLIVPGWAPAARQSYDPGRREVLASFGAAVSLVALSGVEPVQKHSPATFIRPPGSEDPGFNALCIRCNECVRICATQGLQPSGIENGWQNLFTPHLEPRLGHCSYNCNACGQICPSGAIPNLSLEQKRRTPIGLARVDKTRCLPWAYNIDCIICEETCPVADKAIKLEITQTTNALGEDVLMQRPYVVKELCIGCGMCENKCPMGGEAAIRVFAYSEPGGFLG